MKPFTCLLKKEGNQYASLCVELDIASCGKNKKEALEGLRDAAEAYLEYMIAEDRRDEIYRPVPINELKEFLFSGDEISEFDRGSKNLNLTSFTLKVRYDQTVALEAMDGLENLSR